MQDDLEECWYLYTIFSLQFIFFQQYLQGKVKKVKMVAMMMHTQHQAFPEYGLRLQLFTLPVTKLRVSEPNAGWVIVCHEGEIKVSEIIK